VWNITATLAGFPLLPPGFDPRSDHVGFVVDTVVLRFTVRIFFPKTAPRSLVILSSTLVSIPRASLKNMLTSTRITSVCEYVCMYVCMYECMTKLAMDRSALLEVVTNIGHVNCSLFHS
jgi:hypothetical protein